MRLADGRRIGVHRSSGRGPVTVFLHGLMDSRAGWSETVDALGRPSFALDLPGFGVSDLPTRPRLSAYADDVAEALERLGVGRAHVVGHSLGGAVAASLADRHPQRVASLLLLAPAGFGRIALAEAVSVPGIRQLTRLGLGLSLGSGASVRLAYRAMVSNGMALEAEMLERLQGHGAPQLIPAAIAGTQAVVAAGLSERAMHRRRLAYDGPAIAVWGDRDRLVPPSHAEGLRTGLPQASVHVWRGMGHHPQRERPAQLLSVLRAAAARRPRVAAALAA